MSATAKEDEIDVSISLLLVWSVTGCVVLYRTRGWWPKLDTWGSGTSFGQQVKHYLCFLEMCRNLFCVLTLVSWPWIIPRWGMKYFPFFLPRKCGFDVALTADLDSVGILTMCSMTVFNSIIAFYFITRFQQDTMNKISTHDKESRALWLSHIPVHDQATLQQHEVTLEVLTKTIQEDLKTAINNHFRQDQGSATSTGTMVCPLGGCPCNCYVFGCNLACTLVCSCCPRWSSRPHHPGGEQTRRKNQEEVIEDIVAKREHAKRKIRADFPGELTRSNSLVSANRRRSAMLEVVPLEEITVQPVMDKYVDYIQIYQSIKDATEREQTFRSLMLECQKSQNRMKRICGRWWYAKQQNKWSWKLKQRRIAFMDEELGGNLKMSGHAFVVFTDPKARDFMLEPRRRWWELRDHSPFRFGRPPFSSVTLQCRQAPHPTDLQWQNLHVGMCPSFLCYFVALALMVVVTFVFVSIIALSSELEDLKDCLVPASDLNKDWPQMCQVSRWAAQNSLASQLPTLVLLSFNSSVLPLWIEMVSKQRKYHLHSLEHISQMRLNFGVMVLSKTWVPLLSLVAVKMIIVWVAHGNVNTVDFSVLPGILGWREDVIGNVGVFYIKYVLNCAFVSNIISLLQLCRHFYRKCFLCCIAVTARDKNEANECFIFAWGYWYAWSLGIAANGLIMGVAIPSLLPVCALNFATKHFVDKRLFDEAAFNPGPDSKGIFPPRVANCMCQIIALKMLIMGVGLLLAIFYTDASWWSNIYFAYFWVFVLTFLPLLLWISTRVSLLQQQLNEGFTLNEADTCLYKIGCKLTQAVDHLMMFGQNGTSRNSAMREPLATDAEDLTWDAPRVMALDILADEPARDENDELRHKLCCLLGLEEIEGKVHRLSLVEEEMNSTLESATHSDSTLSPPPKQLKMAHAFTCNLAGV